MPFALPVSCKQNSGVLYLLLLGLTRCVGLKFAHLVRSYNLNLKFVFTSLYLPQVHPPQGADNLRV